MNKMSYLQLQVKLLNICSSVLKLEDVKLFGSFNIFVLLKAGIFCVVALGVNVPGWYCYVHWSELSLSSLTEPLGLSLTLFRLSLCYLIFYLNRVNFARLVDRMISDRSSVKPNECHFPVSGRFCRIEVVASSAFALVYIVSVPMMCTVGILLGPNQFKLPFDFNIVGLSTAVLAGYPITAWIIDYIVQVAIAISASSCYVIVQSLVMLYLNHSCFLIDSTLVYVQDLDKALNRTKDPPSHPLQCLCVRRKLKKVKKMVESVVEWQNQTKESLQLIFFVIVTMHFAVLCILIVSVTKHPAESFAAMILTCLILSDLFASCWMGSRVVQRQDKLVIALHGVNWDRMVPNHRKNLLLILLLSQNIKPNHGIFKPIDMTTFQSVIEFNFSVSAILRATSN